LIDDLE
jgi:hypothetical protein